MSNITLEPVESSNIEAIGWSAGDPEKLSGTLRVAFKAGKQYDYADVPLEVYEEMLAAPSAGKFLRIAIAGTYAGTIVPEEEHSSVRDEEENA